MGLPASFHAEPESKDLVVLRKISNVFEQFSLRVGTWLIGRGREAFLLIRNFVTPLSQMGL